MRSMCALRLHEFGCQPEIVPVPVPEPAGAQVLVKVLAAGLCHSDLHLVEDRSSRHFSPPLTLGHEICGEIVCVGPDADPALAGRRVAVHGPVGCGSCDRCAAGLANYCLREHHAIGLGMDGGLADFVLLPSVLQTVPVQGLDPTQVAPLCDAGLTSWSAIRSCRDRLGEESTCLVIGVGGLGHLAVQMLRRVLRTRVIATDIDPESLALARTYGAEIVPPAPPGAPATWADALRDQGVDAVFDMVGSTATLAAGAAALRPGGDLVLVGSAAGRLEVSKRAALPRGARVSIPYWGGRAELAEVMEMATAGTVHVATEVCAFDDVLTAFERLANGEVRGRAVVDFSLPLGSPRRQQVLRTSRG